MDYVPRQVLDAAVNRLDVRRLRDRLYAVRALSEVRGLAYVDDRERERTIEVALVPWLLSAPQLAFFHGIVLTLAGALWRLWPLYRSQAAVREVLRVSPAQRAWMDAAPEWRGRPWAVVGRMDSTAAYDHGRWRRDFMMLEPNAVGVGGVHYAPAGAGVVADVLADVLASALPGRAVRPLPDPRDLLLEELTAVARRLGLPLRGLALIENRDFTTGTDEFRHLAEYFTSRGIAACVADPRQIRVSKGRLWAGSRPVDLVYRDSELQEFIDMEASGRPLSGLRWAVRHGRLVSSLPWELDQKSAWEIFTDARFAAAFTARERAVFARHVPWTRLVRTSRVTDPRGALVDLPAYVRRHQAALVLKPNALFGGEGVTIGREVSARIWQRTLGKALTGKEPHVVQQAAPIRSLRFPSLVDGRVRLLQRCTVSGFFFNSFRIGLVGRFSSKTVVNVSQGGGLISALQLDGSKG